MDLMDLMDLAEPQKIKRERERERERERYLKSGGGWL